MKFALRQLAKSPGFTVVALLTLALGIGVNTTAFTVLNRLFLESLPFRDPSRLVQIWGTSPQNQRQAQAPGDFFDEREQNKTFETVAAYTPGSDASLAEPGMPPKRFGALRVTSNFFSLMGVAPMLGRDFTLDEEMHLESVALLSHRFWKDHYQGDEHVLGRTAKLDSKTYTIIGVMPPAFDDPILFREKPAFFILDATRANPTMRNLTWYSVAARMKPGVTITQAQADLDTIAARLAHDFPKTNQGRGFKVVPYPSTPMGPTGSQLTWMVVALSALVLLIACVNLANLQLVRTGRRAQEFGVRMALGSSRAALAKLLLTESVILSLGGGALGLAIAFWSNAYVARFFDFQMTLNWRVLGFTFLISTGTGCLFGLIPAWFASRNDLNVSMKTSERAASSDRSRHWMRQTLVIVELCLALTLLAGAAFFVTGLSKITHRDLGWHAENVIVGFIELDHDHYGEQKDPRSLVMSDKMQAALAAIPGVEVVDMAAESPAWGFGTEPIRLEGQPPPEPGKEIYVGAGRIGPNFLQVYGIRLIEGRNISDVDRPGSPNVAIINESMAKKFWPHESAVGHRLGSVDPADPAWAEIIGVVHDFEGAGDFYDPGHPANKVLRPWAQNNHRFISFNVRTAGNPLPLKETVRRALGNLAPETAVSELSTVTETLASMVSFFTFIQKILLQISLLGLILAAIGLYGVVANLAAERKKEIGIRMALGQSSPSIIWMFLKNGLVLSVVGSALGLVCAYLLNTTLSKTLPMLPGSDVRSMFLVAALLIVVTAAASWLPALRATRVNPIQALRE